MILSMRFLRLAVAIACLTAATPALAGPPSYLLLRQAETPTTHGHRGAPAGVGYEVRTQGYAYGWFGAAPRTHAQRQFGYYRNYTQWSGW